MRDRLFRVLFLGLSYGFLVSIVLMAMIALFVELK
jgi:hypothetical protein